MSGNYSFDVEIKEVSDEGSTVNTGSNYRIDSKSNLSIRKP
jgi:hypothetical protein